MKKIIQSIIAGIFISVSVFAQTIPNGGFENWSTVSSYQNPNNWDNLNAMTSGMSTYTCVKGTPGNPGSSYLKLVSKNVSMMGVMPGVAVCGVLSTATYQAASGFPFTSRPQSFTGNWQYMASGNDAGFVAVYLTKWNAAMSMRDTVAMLTQSLSGMQMSWTSFSLNFMYMTGETPDSAMITLSSSGLVPVAGSYLYVDNLAFSGNVAGIKSNESLITTTNVFPNPAKDNLTIEVGLQKKSALTFQLVDLTGKMVKEVNVDEIQGKYSSVINTINMTKGIYFLKVIANNAVETKKVIIE